jgi:hypothetical protein
VELFEILFILFFILIPVINGIRNSRRRREEDIQLPGEAQRRPPERPQGAGRTAGGPAEPGYPEPAAGAPRDEPRDDGLEAADLIHDDLWEILTGERRDRSATTRREPEPEPELSGPSEPWEPEPAWQAEELPASKERFEPAPWLEERSDDWGVMVPAEPEPPPRIALYAQESRDARRLRMATQDALDAPPARGVSPLIQALRRPGGVRQAVVLREILGPPKGLS